MSAPMAAGRSVTVQQQARALGDPTRFAIFQHVVAAATPVRVATLTSRFGLNHNAVRQHLAKLCDSRLLVEESAARSGPGRPALQYRPAPGVPGTWGTQGPYQQLSELLLDIVVHGRTPREVGREAGAQAAASARAPVGSSGRGRRKGSAADQSPADSAPAVADRLVDEMQRRGFEPRRASKADSEEIVLDFCPFASVAAVQPDVVCELHRGLAEGFVDGLDGSVEVTGLVARKPQRAGCRLQLRPVRGT